RLLLRLEKLKFIELLPNNRIRLLVSRAFSWIPNGPIQTLFKTAMQTDFFRSGFQRDEEFMVLANGALSKASVTRLHARLKRLAVEFAELRHDDAGVPDAERVPITLLLGMRPWEPELLRRFRRNAARRPATA
ncbi:MAG TPA: XRE family transcriptional regulator, partial [Burkholderiales bacterium]